MASQQHQSIRRRLLAFSLLIISTDALSISPPPRLYQPRLVSDQRSETLPSRRAALLNSIAPSLDNEAWLAALFDGDDIDANNMSGLHRHSLEESLSERILESTVKDATRPNSLVDIVQQSKGVDVNAETVLQLEAQQRRAGLVTASSPTTAKVHPLTKEYEYTLAHAIQEGVRVHTLKSDYESTHGCGLTKKEWASLADIDTATLRQVVANYRWAKQELVSSNMGLVHGIAREFARRNYKKLTLEELIQEGSLGLLRAAELFDPKKGLRFSTYATIWIKGALQNTRVGEFVVLPPAEKKVWRDIQSVVKDRKKGKNNKELDTQTIASTLGMKPHKVETNIHKMTSVANVLSLDYQYTSSSRSGYDYGTKTQESFLKDESLAEQTALKADIVTALVSNLTPQEITLIRLIYGLYDGKEYTIKDSAEILGMNRETTRLLHKSCLRKLREAKEMESLQEYLLTVA